MVEGLKSYLQLTYSLVISYSLYLELLKWRKLWLRRVFGWAIVIILVGCTMEVYIPAVRDISDSYRVQVHTSEDKLYGMGSPAKPTSIAI